MLFVCVGMHMHTDATLVAVMSVLNAFQAAAAKAFLQSRLYCVELSLLYKERIFGYKFLDLDENCLLLLHLLHLKFSCVQF